MATTGGDGATILIVDDARDITVMGDFSSTVMTNSWAVGLDDQTYITARHIYVTRSLGID